MPKLSILGKSHNPRYEGQYYKNDDAIEKVIRYITRTRHMEDRIGELICCGGSGVSFNYGVDYIIHQMQTTQDFYNINDRRGRRLGHEVFSFSDEDFELVLDSDYRAVDHIAQEVCDYYFSKGFEAVYAVHYDEEKHVHIHVAYNYVSYLDGHKYRSRRDDIIEKNAAYLNAYWKAYLIIDKRRKQQMGVTVPLVMNLGKYFWTIEADSLDSNNNGKEKIHA